MPMGPSHHQRSVSPSPAAAKAKAKAMQSCAKHMSPINDYLYLSGMHAVSAEALAAHGITCIIDCSQTPPRGEEEDYPGVEHVRFNIEDVDGEFIHLYFEIANNKISEHRFRHGVVLVHCVLGMSRSATIVLAYLVGVERMPLRDAYLMLRAKRPVIRPNAGFWKQLIHYEKTMRDGLTSVNMVRHNGETLPDVVLRLRQSQAVEAASAQQHAPAKESAEHLVALCKRFRFMTTSRSSCDLSSDSSQSLEQEVKRAKSSEKMHDLRRHSAQPGTAKQHR